MYTKAIFKQGDRPIGLTLERTTFLLMIAAVVALAARRLKLPYTVGLVLTGIGLTLLHVGEGAQLTPHLILEAFLPPLLFEAAIQLPWRDLRREALPLLLLSTAGVLVSAAVVTSGMVYFAHWPWRAALLLGVLIAATDPVSVIATFKESNVHGRVRLLVEAESLFNDGVAAVLFVIALAVVLGAQPVTPASAGLQLVQTAGGGILTGLIVGGAGTLLTWRTSDYLVETTLTAVVAFGSFSLAEHWGASGVLATVTAGLIIGNVGILRSDPDKATLTERGREVDAGLLGLRRVRRQFSDFSADWPGHGSKIVRAARLAGAGAGGGLDFGGPGRIRVLAVPAVRQIQAGNSDAAAARPVLGRNARRFGPRAGPEPAGNTGS